MENLSSSKSHPPETGLVELHHELVQAWGIDFHRVCALVCQLTSSNWLSISDLIAQTILSHWNVTHLLRRLHPWLETDQDHVRIRVAFQDLFRAVFGCSGLSNECILTPYEIAAQVMASRIGPDDLHPNGGQPPGCHRHVGRVGFGSDGNRWEGSQLR